MHRWCTGSNSVTRIAPPPHPTCNDVLALTDADPGGGVSNIQVRYKDAEIARLHNSKRRNRIQTKERVGTKWSTKDKRSNRYESLPK